MTWQGQFQGKEKSKGIIVCKPCMVIVKPFFFNLIFFHLLGKNNDVNMLDKFFLIVGVFADESNYLSFVK
jgi:hypothetical protein